MAEDKPGNSFTDIPEESLTDPEEVGMVVDKEEKKQLAQQAEEEFKTLVFDVSDSFSALSEGRIPEYDSPEDAVLDHAQRLGKTREEYVDFLGGEGFDVRDAMDVVGRGSARGVTEALTGIDPVEYLNEAKAKRKTLKIEYAKQGEQPQIIQQSQKRILEALEERDKEGVELPVEAKSKLRLSRRDKDDYAVDAKTDFVTTENIEKELAISDNLSDEGSGYESLETLELTGQGLGVTNEGLISSNERKLLIPTAAAAKLMKPLVDDDNIAEAISTFEADETGGLQWINWRLNTVANELNLTGDEREDFITSQRNIDRAIAEVGGLKTAGLWSGPLLLPADLFKGSKTHRDTSTLMSTALTGLKLAFTPTVEVIGLARGSSGDRVIFRQSGAMRHAFDVVDGIQQIGGAGVRTLDRDFADARREGKSFFNIGSDERNQRMRDQFINSIAARDDFYKAMTETEFARMGDEEKALATGIAIPLMLLTPDLFGTAMDIAGLAVKARKIRKVNVMMDKLQAMEEGAADLELYDKLEEALSSQTDRLTKDVVGDMRRLNEEHTDRLYNMSPKDDRPAYQGPEAEEVRSVLPNGKFRSEVDGETIVLDRMRTRAPHRTSGARQKTQPGATMAERYSLANRAKEFDDLEKVVDSGDVRVLMPQFREQETLFTDLMDLMDSKIEGYSFKKEYNFDENGGRLLEDPRKFIDDFIADARKADVDLSDAELEQLNRIVTKVEEWNNTKKAAAVDRLREAIKKAKKAIDHQHEARLFTTVVLRQKLASEAPKTRIPFLGVKAPVVSPKLLDLAQKLPPLSPSASLYRKKLIDLGVDEKDATLVSTLYDLKARDVARRDNITIAEWWDKNVVDPEPAPADTTAPDAPAAPRDPDAPRDPEAGPSPEPAPEPEAAEPEAAARADAEEAEAAVRDAEAEAAAEPEATTKPQEEAEYIPGITSEDEPFLGPNDAYGDKLKLNSPQHVYGQDLLPAYDPFAEGVWKYEGGAKAPQDVSVGVLLFDSAGRILLRKPTNNFGGYHWTYAKGGVDAGETPFVAASREMFEETGFSSDDVTFVGLLPKAYSSGSGKRTYYYVAQVDRLPSGTPHWETSSVKFLAPEDAVTHIKQTGADNLKGELRDLRTLKDAYNYLNSVTNPQTKAKVYEGLDDRIAAIFTELLPDTDELAAIDFTVTLKDANAEVPKFQSMYRNIDIEYGKWVSAQSEGVKTSIVDPQTSGPTFNPTPENPSVDNIAITPESPGPAVVEADFDLSMFERVGEKQGGYSSSGFIGKKSDDGTLWLVKEAPLSADDAEGAVRNEVLNANLYRLLMGEQYAPDTRLVKSTSEGTTTFYVASRFNSDVGEDVATPKVAAQMSLDTLSRSFVVDAILGIWDTVPGNVYIVNGEFFRVDFGGGLDYRASGKLKKLSDFGPVVFDFQTLTDPKFPASLFYKKLGEGGDSIDPIIAMKTINALSDPTLSEQIALIVTRYAGKNPEYANSLIELLQSRVASAIAQLTLKKTTKQKDIFTQLIEEAEAPKAKVAKAKPDPKMKLYFDKDADAGDLVGISTKSTFADAPPSELQTTVADALSSIDPSGSMSKKASESLIQSLSKLLQEGRAYSEKFVGYGLFPDEDADSFNIVAAVVQAVSHQLPKKQTLNKFLGAMNNPTPLQASTPSMHKASVLAEILSAHGQSPATRELAKILVPILKSNDSVLVGHSGKNGFNAQLKKKGSFYQPLRNPHVSGVVVLDLDNTSEALIMHELLHAATVGSMEEVRKYENALRFPDFASETASEIKARIPNIDQMLDAYTDLAEVTLKVRTQATKDYSALGKKVKKYADSIGVKVTKENRNSLAVVALSSEEFDKYQVVRFLRRSDVLGSANKYSSVVPEELITYAMTNPYVRDYLDKVKVKGKKSAFQTIVSAILRLIGAKDSPQTETLLSESIRSSVEFLREVELSMAMGLNPDLPLPAATAGVEELIDVADAELSWQKLGTESPYFKKWAEGLPLRNLPEPIAKGETPTYDGLGEPGVYMLYHGSQDLTDKTGKVRTGDYIGFKPEFGGQEPGKETMSVFFVDAPKIAATYSSYHTDVLKKSHMTSDAKYGKSGLFLGYVKTKLPLHIYGKGANWSEVPMTMEAASLERNQPFMRGLLEYTELRSNGVDVEDAMNQAFRNSPDPDRFYPGTSSSKIHRLPEKLSKRLIKRMQKGLPPLEGDKDSYLSFPDDVLDSAIGKSPWDLTGYKAYGSGADRTLSIDVITKTDSISKMSQVYGFDSTIMSQIKDAVSGGSVDANVVMAHKPASVKAADNPGTFSFQPGFYKAKSSLVGAAPGEDVEALVDYAENGVNARRFREWFGNAYTPDGTPEVLYHGTSADFERFINGSGESQFGSLSYFTNSIDDVNTNYADIDGADIQAKIERRMDLFDQYDHVDEFGADSLADAVDYMIEGGDYSDDVREQLVEVAKQYRSGVDEVIDTAQDFIATNNLEDDLARATAELTITNGNRFSIMPVYAKIDNPVIIDKTGGREMTMFGEDILDVIRSVVAKDYGRDKIVELVLAEIMNFEEISAFDLHKIIMENAYYFDEVEDAGNGELFNIIIQSAGYDGIVAHAYDLFGPRKGPRDTMLPGMAGVSPGTYHYHTARPTQVKSVFNKGTFNSYEMNILRARGVVDPDARIPEAPLPPQPEIIRLEDGRVLLRAFENGDINDVVAATSEILRRDLTNVQQDVLLDFVNDALGLELQRRGSVFFSTNADEAAQVDEVRRADELINQLVAKYIIDGEVPPGAQNLSRILEDIQADLTTSYRVARVSDLPVNPEIAEVFDPLLRNMPADTNPLTLITNLIQSRVPKQTAQLGNFFGALSREASRQGSTVDVDDVVSRVDEAIKAGDSDAIIVESPMPLFPEFVLPKSAEDGVYRYTLDDLANLQRQFDDRLKVDPERTFRFKSELLGGSGGESAAERFYKLVRTREEEAVDPERLERNRQFIAQRIGEDAANKLFKNAGTGKFENAAAAFIRGVFRLAAGAILGGDENLDISNLPLAMQAYIKRGIRTTEQASGDSIHLTVDYHTQKTASKKARAREKIIDYLSGEIVEFLEGGRTAATSGTDKFLDLAYETQMYLRRDREYVFKGVSFTYGELLDRFAWSVSAKQNGKVVKSPFAKGAPQAGVEPKLIDLASDALIRELFETEGPKGYQFFADVHTSIVGSSNTKALTPKQRQVYESVLYHMGVTRRYGKYVLESASDALGRSPSAGGTSRQRVELFLSEIENAVHGESGDKAAGFGAHTGASSFSRMVSLLGTHGTAVRVRQTWVDQGVYIKKSVFDELGHWVDGSNVDPELRPDVMRVADYFGLNPNFVEEPILESNFYIPRAARARLTEALARSVVSAKDSSWAFSVGNIDSIGLLAQVWLRFVKVGMVRGNFILKQKYFYMNTVDHFNQTAQILGFRPAIVSTTRLVINSLVVAPGASVALAALRKGQADGPEIFRKFLQRLGDKVARDLMGRLLGVSKWRVDVNPVLEGSDGFVRLGNNVYSYKALRDIAVEEGIFASFETTALRKVLGLAQKEQIGSNLFDKALAKSRWWQDHLSEISEAWSERERLGLMITLIEAGAQPRAAARAAIEVLFDYAGTMSKGDRQWWVSLIYPFWAFQKNANRMFINSLFNPHQVYRMGILRRGRELFSEVMTDMLYEEITDEYGVDVYALSPESREAWAMIKRMMEYGFGPIENLNPSTLRLLTQTFGPLDQLTEEDRNFIENGYSLGRPSPEVAAELKRVSMNAYYHLKYEPNSKPNPRVQAEIDALSPEARERIQRPNQVPPRIKMQLRLYFTGGALATSPFVEAEGSVFAINRNLLPDMTTERTEDVDLLEEIQGAGIPKYDPSAGRTFSRDMTKFGFTPKPSKMSYLYMKMQNQANPDYPFFEVWTPESSMEAAVRHTTGILALMMLGVEAGIDLGIEAVKSDVESPSSKFSGSLYIKSVQNSVKQVFDPERAPLVQNILPYVSDNFDGAPTRVAPLIKNVLESVLPVSLLTIDSKSDLFGLVSKEELTETQALEIMNIHTDLKEKYDNAVAEDPSYGDTVQDPGPLPKVLPMVDKEDARVSELSAMYPQASEELVQKIIDVSDELEMNPADLAQVMKGESGFKADVYNKAGLNQGKKKSTLAVGLIQFVPKTAKSLGTTTSDLAAMTPVEQMDFVYKYLSPYKGQLNSFDDVAMAVFYPVALDKPDSFSIADHYYNSILRSQKRKIRKDNPGLTEGSINARAITKAQIALNDFRKSNPNIDTRGDYVELFRSRDPEAAANFEKINEAEPEVDYSTAPDPKTTLPLRSDAAEYKITEERHYLFPGIVQALAQSSGLLDLNRALLKEAPIAMTPFEEAAIGEPLTTLPEELGGGKVPDLSTRAGKMIWARTILGMYGTTVQRSASARSDEPREQSTTINPVKK